MKPEIICHIMSSVDGRLINSRWTALFDGRHGTLAYDLIDITGVGSIDAAVTGAVSRYNVYDLNGVRLLSNATSISSVAPGLYIVNGAKTLVTP